MHGVCRLWYSQQNVDFYKNYLFFAKIWYVLRVPSEKKEVVSHGECSHYTLGEQTSTLTHDHAISTTMGDNDDVADNADIVDSSANMYVLLILLLALVFGPCAILLDMSSLFYVFKFVTVAYLHCSNSSKKYLF